MKRNVEVIVSNWLKKLEIPVSKGFIKNQIRSHPEYPSLLSITDTLDELSIDNASLVVDKERIGEIPVPFLAHITKGGGDLLLVTDIEKTKKKVPHFLNEWDGIVLVAEKPMELLHTENAKELAKEKKQRELQLFAVVSIIVLSLGSLLTNFSWTAFALLATAMAGCFVGVLLIQHELGIDNAMTEQLCQTGKHTDCDAVLHSKKSKLFNWLNLPDVVLIWFSSLLLLLTVSFYTGNVIASLEVIALLTACAVPVTLASLYYQWRVVKKWCTLCLLTIALLWMQAGILLPEVQINDFTSAHARTIGSFIFAGLFIGQIWLLLFKSLLKNIKDSTIERFKLLRFKNNPENFKSVLLQQRRADITPFENDIEIGNRIAGLHIMVCCSLHCNPCTRAHKVLQEIADKGLIGLTVRFYLSEDKNDPRINEVGYLLQVLSKKPTEYKRMAMNDWYRNMDFKKYKEKYPLTEEINISDQLEFHAQWTNKTEIKFTPTVFINGYQLPKQYEVEDLRNLLPRIAESEFNKSAVNEIS